MSISRKYLVYHYIGTQLQYITTFDPGYMGSL
jgi:hypothetical protein